MSSESYVREINNLDAELKRCNDRAKMLREKKQKARLNLYNYMVRHNLTQVQNGDKVITIEQCKPPKPRNKVKPKKQRISEALELFRSVGIPNPEEFYSEFESTQKIKNTETIGDGDDMFSPYPKKKKGKSEYDDLLGF